MLDSQIFGIDNGAALIILCWVLIPLTINAFRICRRKNNG